MSKNKNMLEWMFLLEILEVVVVAVIVVDDVVVAKVFIVLMKMNVYLRRLSRHQ